MSIKLGVEHLRHFFELLLTLFLHTVRQLGNHEGLDFELLELLNVFVGDTVCNAEPNQLGGGFVLLVMFSKLPLHEDTEIGKRLIRLGLNLPFAEGRFKFAGRLERGKGKGKLQFWVLVLPNFQ